MQLFGSLHILLLLAASCSSVLCQSQNATFIADEIAKIPACGLSCLEFTVPSVGCTLLNTTCQCASTRLYQITAECMMANCTLEEAVDLDKVSAAICERPYESRNYLIHVTSIVCMVITYTAVGIRLVTRYCLHQSYRLDDWFILGAAVTDAVFTGFGIAFERHGFGEHVWEINVDMIPQLLYWFYLCEVFYVITISLIKLSVMTFYLQVFPTRSFRIQCWAVMAFCVASAFAFLLVTIFQCHPISYVWNKNIRGGKCVNFNLATWVNGGVNILQDILIVGLPISEVRTLKLGRRQKVGLYAMFGLGGFVCVTSMVRLRAIKTFGLTTDATWDNIPITFWTTLETTTAMLCTCLPAMRAGLLRVFPQALGSSAANASSAVTLGKQPMTTYQKSFGTSWRPKSWPSQRLSSLSSLSEHKNEDKSAEDGSEKLQDLEAAPKPSPSLIESLNKPLPSISHVYRYGVKDLLATPFRPINSTPKG